MGSNFGIPGKVTGHSRPMQINQSVMTGPDVANRECGRGPTKGTSGSVVDFAEGFRFFFILVVSQQKIVSLSII